MLRATGDLHSRAGTRSSPQGAPVLSFRKGSNSAPAIMNGSFQVLVQEPTLQALRVKLFVTWTSQIVTQVEIQTALLLTHVPASVSGKATVDGPCHTSGRTEWSSAL